MKLQSQYLFLALAAVAFVGVGCTLAEEEVNPNDNVVVTDSATNDNAAEVEVMEKDDAAMEKPAAVTIAELASSVDTLSTLVAALTAADLVEVFADEDAEYTVFAPTNAAFADIQETVDSLLLPENKATLQNVLQYHVVEGKVMAEDLTDGQVVTMLNGDTATVSIADGKMMIGDATVVTADVDASNGVVHIIDTVLVP